MGTAQDSYTVRKNQNKKFQFPIFFSFLGPYTNILIVLVCFYLTKMCSTNECEDKCVRSVNYYSVFLDNLFAVYFFSYLPFHLQRFFFRDLLKYLVCVHSLPTTLYTVFCISTSPNSFCCLNRFFPLR